MKRIFIFVLSIVAVLSLIFLLAALPFIKDDAYCKAQKSKMISEIESVPNLEKIASINQTKDFSPIFDLYIEMKGGVKIIFRKVHYENETLFFDTIPRFGDYGFLSCEYDISRKHFTMFQFDIYDEYDYIAYKVGESPFCTKSVLDILKNYNYILAQLSTFHLAKKDFLDHLKNGNDEVALHAFDGNISNRLIGYQEIRCMYKCSDEYAETFFGMQSQWKTF